MGLGGLTTPLYFPVPYPPAGVFNQWLAPIDRSELPFPLKSKSYSWLLGACSDPQQNARSLISEKPLKTMDSFGKVVKIKWNNFSSLNHNFIVLCELLMPCQLFAQKCSNCQEITQISKCSGSPRTLDHGNIHRDILLLGIITLQHVIQNDCRWVNGAFWWYGPLSEDREIFKQIYQNYLVALTQHLPMFLSSKMGEKQQQKTCLFFRCRLLMWAWAVKGLAFCPCMTLKIIKSIERLSLPWKASKITRNLVFHKFQRCRSSWTKPFLSEVLLKKKGHFLKNFQLWCKMFTSLTNSGAPSLWHWKFHWFSYM